MKKCIDRFRMTSKASINLGKTPEAFGEENLAMYASRRRGWQLGIVLALGIGGVIGQTCDRANSQSNIVPDRTLGNENSVVVPNFNGLPVEVIQGGAARGQNLFHSFRDFNVSTGRGAYFFSPNSNIQNILTRVSFNLDLLHKCEIRLSKYQFSVVKMDFCKRSNRLQLGIKLNL